MERTLIVFKPDSVQRAVVGEILTRFEKVGLKIVGMKMVRPDAAHFHEHYETIGKVISRHNQRVFDNTVRGMTSGPVIAVVLEGGNAAAQVRKMVGATEPKESAPGTIRGDYAHMSYARADELSVGVPNLIHASGDAEEAKLEIELWFDDSELFDYESAHDKHTL